MYKDVRRTRAVYVCKNGWARTGIGCTKRKFIYNWQLSVEFTMVDLIVLMKRNFLPQLCFLHYEDQLEV